MTRGQLLARGLSEAAIERRLARGRLHPVMPGVYVVGRSELSREGRWVAAVRACGPDAVLSHGSAAALWGIGKERDGVIEVSVRTESAHRRPGLRVHRRPGLGPGDVTFHRGIPVTRPVLTLVDQATWLDHFELERAVCDADKHGWINPEALRRQLERYRGQRGVARLRTRLDRRTFRLSDAKLELLFRPLARAAGLPEPLTKQWVNDYEVDFHWPELGLVVETDGRRYHRTPFQQVSDQRRDQIHTVTGLISLRFAHEEIKYEPAHVRDILAQALSLIREKDRKR